MDANGPQGDGSHESPVTLEPAIKLFFFGSIGWAAFLGSPFAAGVLLAANSRRTGNSHEAMGHLFVSGAMTLAMVGTSAFAASSLFAPLLPVLGMLATLAYANFVEGDALRSHAAGGGELEPGWKAFVISVLMAGGLFVLTYAVFSMGR